ncbi:MAPEG family protein [Hoeflea poritis]|uniref:MAPEG family protein n=1 Tax=Hoeflea poritis TaxID=2993659 RepID=A0ABT4VVT5_9HYPH|nr:MAPEG family protein [Hoeflea poritis]MDA4848825.1 MAPEG family protein [Hoeflea poritis]
MPLEITGIYASLLAIVMIVLSVRVSMLRAQSDIPMLHGENIQLAEWVRRHGNFTENAPMGLILMGIVEAFGASFLLLNVIGGTLLVGRIVHPFGIAAKDENKLARGAGALLTAISMLICVVFILVNAL